ncbi:MAG: hypothetical protein NT062_08550 [Proteobacteria bacterium]|nr:hypothetical protein [Pseudomonadota bacterium]
MNAVIVERDKLVARKVARVLAAVGWPATIFDEPARVGDALVGADLLCGDAFDGDFIAEAVRRNPALRAMLWTAEPLKRSLRYLAEAPIDHVLARKDFESPPRAWELAMTAKRLRDGVAAPLTGYVDFGHSSLELDVTSTQDRDLVLATLGALIATLGVPKRVIETFAELGHELLMNAMYDAPIDDAGQPKYAADRKAALALELAERPRVRFASDGSRLVLQVRDPFGRLERRHVVDGLVRGLGSGDLDRAGGGAGLGLTVCHHASSSLVFDVAHGRSTEVTATYELDQNLRDLRTQAKSLHLWCNRGES